MSATTLVFGADGGGTKTLGIVADGKGKILSRRQVGPSNQNVVGIDTAARNIADLISQTCREAGCAPSDLQAVVLGLAGAGGPDARANLSTSVNAFLDLSDDDTLEIIIETDARIGLEGSFDGGPGIVVIAGTGSVVVGKSESGNIVQVGGWGRMLGDEGSGFSLGTEALRAVSRDFDGTSEAKILRGMFEEHFGWTNRERIIAAVYRERFEIPAIAPLVLEAASAGDHVSIDILVRASKGLAEQVRTLTRHLRAANETGASFIGGLIDHETSYEKLLRDELHSFVPNVCVRKPLHPPAYGAVLLALRQPAAKK